MKVFISVDMEGVSGIAGPDDVTPGTHAYESRGRDLMTGDANAAIAGAFDGGATEVLVNDSHSSMTNLISEKLDERATLISGGDKSHSMTHGLDRSFGLAMFVGYHAMTGTSAAVLNHTMMGREIVQVRLNGEPAGETRLNAAYSGMLGVPVGLVTGDDKVCAEATSLLGDVEAVAVKRGIDKYAAELTHPAVAQRAIRESAQRAVEGATRFTPYRVQVPFTLGVTWNSTTIAAHCGRIPGVAHTGPRKTEFTSDSYEQVLGVFEIMLFIADGVTARANTYD
jgi:D-amino peptidase